MEKLKTLFGKHYMSFILSQWGFLLISIFYLLRFKNHHIIVFYLFVCILNIFIFELIYIIILANKSNSNGNNDFAEKCKYKNNIINILRLERHDYFNHLQVLYGLLQLKRYDKLNGQINKMLKELGKDNSLLSVKEPYLLEVLYNGKLNARENNIDLKIEIENPLYSGKTATQRRKIEFAKHLEFFLSVLMDNINGLIQKNKKISINIGSSSKGKTYGLITYPGIIYDDILMDLKNKNDILKNIQFDYINYKISKTRLLVLIETV